MKPLSTRDLTDGAGGKLRAGAHRTFAAVTIDSRVVPANSAFFCIRGPRFDGHDFAVAASEAGARVVVADRALPRLSADTAVVHVADCNRALGVLAAIHRGRFTGTVVGLTGSSGKTTTKEFIAAVLATAGNTWRTPGNLNNHLGVPLTLLQLRAEFEFAVVEMGMNAPGEIAYLTSLSDPEVGVVTTVGEAHLAGLGSLAAVAAAKGELFSCLRSDGLAVMLSDVALPWILTRGLRSPLMLVGPGETDEVRLVDARETASGAACTIVTDGGRHPLQLRLAGRHNLSNAVLAIAVGRALGVPVADAVAAIGEVPAPAMRGEIRTLPSGRRVVLDCYNANPQSMAAAVKTFAAQAPNGMLVLGDMLELGRAARPAHAQVGRLVAALPGRPTLITVGPLARHIATAAREFGLPRQRIVQADDADAAAVAVARIETREPILLKASRGMHLETVWQALTNGEG